MSILTILLVIIVAVSVYYAVSIANGKALSKVNFRHQLAYVKAIGRFTMIVGILGQLIGLMMAFTAIEAAMDISPAIIAGGLKVSMITTLTGIFFYLISVVFWFILDLWFSKKESASQNG